MTDWKDTIEEVLKLNDDYTLLKYTKGGRIEYNVAYKYNPQEKSWASGNYSYSLENALYTCLEKMNSKLIKGRNQMMIENNYSITFERMDELCNVFMDEIICNHFDNDIEYVAELLVDERDMTRKEMEYFGVDNILGKYLDNNNEWLEDNDEN